MSKKIRKHFLIGLLFINMLILTQPAVLADNQPKTSLEEQMELIQNDIKIDDLDIEPINTDDIKKNVVPNTKQEGKKVLFLFLKAMFLVAVAAGIASLILMFIKKYRASAFSDVEYEEFTPLNLASPVNKQEAFMSFLNRTGF